MIKVLVVEDSPTVRELLLHILKSDPELQVVGTASNGLEAIDAVRKLKPDVVTMDVHMPVMNGFEASRQIMENHPTPIVVVSDSHAADETAIAFRALEAGAVSVAPKPSIRRSPAHDPSVTQLVQTIKLMAEVKVVRRWAKRPRKLLPCADSLAAEARAEREPVDVEVLAMGASTGGPPVLQAILSRVTPDFSVPVLIVQHIASGFIQGFVEWLATSSALPVEVARHGQAVLPGHAYVAPDGVHMKVARGGIVVLSDDPPENGLRPAVSYLFRSVSEVYGASAIGVLLTGMGRDGAEELKLMRDRGAVTMVQDKESSVVHGMPGEAIRLEAASYVLSPEDISVALTTLVNHRRKISQYDR